jgi:hypothetical protein
MDRGLPLRIPIENFIVTADENYPNKYRLIYFDPRGQRHEVLVRKSTMDSAIQKLDGKPKAISRSSGGLAPAQPYQLVIHHHVSDSTQIAPEIRIKVRFKEFARGEAGNLTAGSVVTMTKNILPEEVLDQISYDLNSSQKFLMDFGHGVVPVVVFGFVSDQSGENYALFVESDSIEKAMREGAGKVIRAPRYRASRELVRAVRDGENAVELFEKARQNAERLRSMGQPVIPESLQVGQPVELPTGQSYAAICNLLRRSVHRWNRQEEDHTFAEIEVPDEGCVTSDFVMYMEPI